MVGRVLRATLQRSLLRSVAVAAAAVVLLTGAVAPASAAHREPSLRVMTRNLYLGADLTPALAARNPTDFFVAVAEIYAAKQATNFTARAEAIADEIDRTGPDLIGLQEVSQWDTLIDGEQSSQDFLAVLQQALSARGLDYAVAEVSRNAVIGPVPLVTPCESPVVGACQLTFTDRDVILVNEQTRRLHWHNPRSGTYATQFSFTPPLGDVPVSEVSFSRGWASIDGKFRGRPFHFVTTHLETAGFAEIQQAQAQELLAGPAFGRGTDLVVGDFNSGPAANRPSTATYGLLTDRLRDAWGVRRRAPGYTCCQESTLADPAPQFNQRIDLILVHGAKPLAARRVGNRPFTTTPPPVWASDHAGVVADVRLAKKRLS